MIIDMQKYRYRKTRLETMRMAIELRRHSGEPGDVEEILTIARHINNIKGETSEYKIERNGNNRGSEHKDPKAGEGSLSTDSIKAVRGDLPATSEV